MRWCRAAQAVCRWRVDGAVGGALTGLPHGAGPYIYCGGLIRGDGVLDVSKSLFQAHTHTPRTRCMVKGHIII
jgi:hypothetical protein